VKLGDINYNIPEFKNLSEDAFDFMKQLLEYDPMRRIELVKALDHPFIKKYDDFKQDSHSVLKCLLAL